MSRKITIQTTTKKSQLEAPENFTIEQILLAYKYPVNLFQGYLKENKDLLPFSLNKKIKDIPSNNEIIVQCLRNIDFDKVKSNSINKTKTHTKDKAVTFIKNSEIIISGFKDEIVELDDKDSKAIVNSTITEFFDDYSSKKIIIAGISGGGDSNALVKSLALIEGLKAICFTIVFEPIWHLDSAKRAKSLCNEHNLEHHIFTSSEIEKEFGMKGSLEDFYNEFCSIYGNDTDEIFATYLVAKLSRKLCTKYKSQEFCLGYNREDVLADLMLFLINGQNPLEFPIRKFGNHKLLMPLWEIPKSILDACYPKYSLSNYEERIEKTTNQRHNIYYISHLIDDSYTNLGLSIMKGVKKIFDKKEWAVLDNNTEYDLFVSRYSSENIKNEFIELYKKYFN